MISDTEFSMLIRFYPVLAELSSQLQGDFKRDACQVAILTGEILFDVGSDCHSYLFLTSGSFNVITYQESRQILLLTSSPGDWCWDTVSCLLASRNHLTCGIATQPSSGTSISQLRFRQMVANSEAFRTSLFSSFGQGLFQLITLIQEVSFQQIDQRLAAILLSKGDLIVITHQQLADELGSVREVVSRILKKFEKRGFLHRSRGQIQIINRAALEEIAKP